MTGPGHRWVLAVSVVVVVATATGAGAQDVGTVSDGPTIALDRAAAAPGERVRITLTGWRGRAVTLSVCGNRAARGSMDCNLTASQGVPLNRDGSATVTDLMVSSPTLPCPCVVLASSTRNEQKAIAPLDLVGHPVGPIIESVTQIPIVLTLEVRRASGGLVGPVRSTLGGPTSYEVTVTVTNQTTDVLSGVVVAGTVGRTRNDDVAGLDLPAVGPLEPGQTWAYTARPTVPAPAIGTFVVQAVAAGAGPTVTVEDSVRAFPLGLIVLGVVFAVDVVAIIWRRLARRRDEDAGGDDDGSVLGVGGPVGGASPLLVEERPLVPVA